MDFKLADGSDGKTINYAALEQHIKSWSTLSTDGNKWLAGAVDHQFNLYRNLRQDLSKNAQSWSYDEYCERVAFHYYDIAFFYYNELFGKHFVDLASVRTWLTRCLEKLNEASSLTKQSTCLKQEAEKNLMKVNQLFQQIENLTDGAQKQKILGLDVETSIMDTLSLGCKSQLLGIRVLKLIILLEDKLSLPEQKYTETLINQCSCLVEIYNLAERVHLSKYYNNASKKIRSNKKSDECIDKIIYNEIEKVKSTVEEVKEYLGDIYQKQLSSYDIAYVEKKYFEVCSNFWHTDISESLKHLSKNKNSFALRNMFDTLDSLKNLDDIPDMFNNSPFLSLLKLFSLNEDDKHKLIQRLKQQCLSCVLEFSASATIELRLIENFAEFFSISPDLEELIVVLQLKDFMCGKISMQHLLENILKLKPTGYGNELLPLQNTAQCLDKSNDLFLLNEFKQVISNFMQPVTLEVKFMDGRLTVEVTGGYIIVSKKKQELENQLKANSKIEEVRFVGAHALHIDVNFDGAVWKGKNIVVCAKLIRIHGNITWDVSGKDSDHKYTYKADAERDGSDGFAGESGGNVLLLGKRFDRAKFFKVVSNGGLGSPGQDGGDGKNGADGKGIEKKDLETKFKSLARVLNFNSDRATFLSNIEQECSTKPFKWFSKYDDRYVEARTDGGNEIIYSFCNSLFFTAYQNYFIYKGSHGMPGTIGGKAGLGGEGGFCGQIEIKNFEDDTTIQIATQAAKGSDGSNGQAGLNGRHGKNGWDMAYIDFETWFNPTYYGEDCKSTCTASCYEERASDRVICPYNSNKYVGITQRTLQHPSQERYRNANKKKTQERQHHARAVGKKTISKSNILTSYAQNLNCSVESTLQSLQTELDRTKQQAHEAILENQEQQSKIRTETRFERSAQYIKLKTSLGTIEPLKSEKTELDIEAGLKTIKKNLSLESPANLEEWTLDEVQDKFPIIKQLESSFLMVRRRFSVTEEIASKLQTQNSSIDEVLLSAHDAAKYLITRHVDSSISHKSLGMLDHCLNKNEKCEIIVDYALNELKNGNINTLKSSVRRFLQEIATESKLNIDRHYKVFKEWNDNNETCKSETLTQLITEIIKPEHAEYCELWQRCIRDLSLKEKFKFAIQKRDELTASYNRYTDKCEEMFNCEQCLSDVSFKNEFINHLKEAGISGCYRELLACAFDVNIRLYKEIQDGEFSLIDEHNSSASNVCYYLINENTFIPLAIDSSLLKLAELRIKESDRYGNILEEVDLLEDETQVKQYLDEQMFVKNSHNMYCGEPMEQEDMDNHIDQIVAYFPANKRNLLKKQLSKIASVYEKSVELILGKLLNRLMSDGRHISCDEMCCILNYILKSGANDNLEGNHFCWIFASYRQRDWISEILLLQLEAFFRQQIKSKVVWREYLKKIEQRNAIVWLSIKLASEQSNALITEQHVENILKLLSVISNETLKIAELHLTEWVYALNEQYYTDKMSKLIVWDEHSEKIPLCSYYVHSIVNIYGQSKMEQLLGQQVMKSFNAEEIIYVLQKFYTEEWILDEFVLNRKDCNDKRKWMKLMHKRFKTTNKERSFSQLLPLIKCNESVLKGLQSIEEMLKRIKDRSKTIIDSEEKIKPWLQNFSSTNTNLSDTERLVEVVSAIVKVIEIKKNITLRDTQLLAILTMLTNDQSTLAQVSTGEGKSLIVVSVAIAKVLINDENIDIITSSVVLAKRDAEANRDIFRLFGIGVSHNCSVDTEKRRMAYSGNKVIYGVLSIFQRDYLLDKFYHKNILGDRRFLNVIVDEVDSMLLDKGNNMLYLSHDLANFDKLESVYIFIWQWMNRPARDYQDLKHAFDSDAIKEAIMRNIHGLIKPEDIGKLDTKLSDEDRRFIWSKLFTAGILDYHSKLCVDKIDRKMVEGLLKPRLEKFTDRLLFLIQECIKRDRKINIPNHLIPFVEKHLDSWIMSAKTAFFMRAGQDYVVDVDRSGTRAELNPNIVILDRDTGTDEASSQWEAALHQFLQIKHGCKISLQSLKAVFISNVTYLKLYKHLFGLTGTLGSQRERVLLEEMYKIDLITIPTAKCKQFIEYNPIVCSSQSEWKKRIIKETVEQTEKNTRSVLIICETVNDVESLYVDFGGQANSNVVKYTRDYEKFGSDTDENKLNTGKIIIATNLAGRGTDIKITEELKNAGGLHVCLTFLPSNVRIEQQAFGRAARCGDQGSGQLVLWDPEGQQYTNLRVIEMKKKRDAEELQRISDIKTYYDKYICVEENLFTEFKECYEQLKLKISYGLNGVKFPKTVSQQITQMVTDLLRLTESDLLELEEILLRSCLDKWVFWLDEHNNLIGKDNKKLQRAMTILIKQLNQLTCNNVEDLSKWVKGNPSQTIKLGKFLLKNTESTIAEQLFEEVIEQEPNFSDAAHYYKAHALAKKSLDSSSAKKTFKREIQEAKRLFDMHKTNAIYAGSIVGNIKKYNKESILQIEAFEEQQKSICEIYQTFIESIDNLMNQEITPQTLMNDQISECNAEQIIKELIKKGVLKGTRVAKNINFEKLSPIADSYGIPRTELKNIISSYKGCSIDLNNFIKILKRKISLASREIFWKALIDQNVLIGEKQYVFVELEEFNKMDSSITSKLEKVNLDKEEDDLLLYPEFIEEQKQGKKVFLKNKFKEIVGRTMYDAMKKKGTISSNKKARRMGEGKKVRFSHFDSIKKTDFGHIGISESESTVILEQLIKANIITKTSTQDNTFVAGENFHAFKELDLPSCSIYEDAVIGLLASSFAYRRALQALTGKSRNSLIHLQVRPHQSLLGELMEQGIIKSVTVAKNKDNIEKTVEEVMEDIDITIKGRTMTVIESIDKNVGMIVDVVAPGTIAITRQLEIERQKKAAAQHVLEALDHCKGPLKALEVPQSQLVSLEEFLGREQFPNAEEVYVFSINGLDQLLKLGEKKWTWKMIRNTFTVIALGVGQIVLGTIIQAYSLGLMTHVGVACISEGYNDIFFAAGVMTSGYFSWKGYRQHKLQSLKMTVLTVGVGALFSRGAKVSQFGYKLTGPQLNVGEKKVAEMCGQQLFNTVGYRKIANEAVKQITMKSVQAIAFGMANAGVDYLIENHLRAYCEGLIAKIIEAMENPDKYHDISVNLKKIFVELGSQETKDVVSVVTNKVFLQDSQQNQIISTIRSFAGGVIQGLGAAMEKRSMTNNPLVTPIQKISYALKALEYGEYIFKMVTLINNLLSQLNSQLTKEFQQKVKNKNATSTESNYKVFVDNTIDNWKKMMRQQVAKNFEQNFVTPLLKKCAYFLVTYAGKEIQKSYQTCKENKYEKSFEDLKEKFEEDLETVEKQDNDGQVEKNLEEQYHKELLKLMKMTSSNKLFAQIVSENVPMDFVCVEACAKAITKYLKSKGISNPSFTIVAQADNGLNQEFSSNPGGEKGTIIPLKLKDGHYQVVGGANSNATNNNCLCTAVLKSFSITDVTPEQLRDQIVDTIRNDDDIANHIRNGWHRVPLSQGAFGGKTVPTTIIKTERLNVGSSFETPEYYLQIPQNKKRQFPSVHFRNRLGYNVRYVATEQAISSNTGITIDNLTDKSDTKKYKYQDQSSGRGDEKIDAAHLVAADLKKHSKELEAHPEASKLLANIKGRTENVENIYNRGPAGTYTDKTQRDYYHKLHEIDFSANEPSEAALSNLRTYKQKALGSLLSVYEKNQTDSSVQKELYISIQMIHTTKERKLYKMGHRQFIKTKNELETVSNSK